MEKDITFIYSDEAEKSMYLPIALEAQRRGYTVAFTMDKTKRCEIGFYCQHINHPQYSRFSLIMLHDIVQQHGNWPDLWYREPWDKYDIGFLPSSQWIENWNQCSQWPYARPRIGVFEVGWPKADALFGPNVQKMNRSDFEREYGLDPSKPTILYAPSWENDGKEDDFVKAAIDLGVNLIVKQAPIDPLKYPDMYREIERMKELHKDLQSVTILPPELNIFYAIAVADILVSDESSTMCEATMMGIPTVAVTDWLIPDVTPSRYPTCDYDFVNKTVKAELHDTLQTILDNYEKYKQKAEEYSRTRFSNLGKTSITIMDIVDDCVAGRPVRYESLSPKPLETVPLNREVRRRMLALRREFSSNYAERYKPIGLVFNAARKVKKAILGAKKPRC